MRYLVVIDYQEEGHALHEFPSRLDAECYLQELSKLSNFDVEDYRLIEFTQEFDVRVALDKHRERVEVVRADALLKLTDEEKIVLGLTKS